MAIRRINLSGKQIGYWDVIAIDKFFRGETFWTCKCACGAVRSVRQGNLVKGCSRSCGCKNNQFFGDYLLKRRELPVHRIKDAPEYHSWCNMKGRCYNPNTQGFKYWGGRGIAVCQEWIDSFQAFLDHIGPQPSPKHVTVDRIKNELGYEPGNVRWATRPEQARNRRNCHQVTFRGKTQTVREWERELGFPCNTLYQRIVVRKWPIQDAFLVPRDKKGFRLNPAMPICKHCGGERTLRGKKRKLICRPCATLATYRSRYKEKSS